jgi:hypothetical protein
MVTVRWLKATLTTYNALVTTAVLDWLESLSERRCFYIFELIR